MPICMCSSVYLWPSQVVLTIGQNFWTAEVASGIQAGADGLKKIYDMHCRQLEAIVALVRGPQVCGENKR